MPALGDSISLLIVRLSAMGDIIHTLPAATALRQAFPHATLGWLIEERWAELLCALRYPRSGARSPQRPLVDRVHAVNMAEWRRSLFSFNTWQQIAVGLKSVTRGIQYDAVIDFQGAIRSALLARWSGASIVYGDAQPRENAASMFYTRKVSCRLTVLMSSSKRWHWRPRSRNAVDYNRNRFNAACKRRSQSFPWIRMQRTRSPAGYGGCERFRDSQSRRRLGSEEWPAERYGRGCEGTRKRWIMFARKLRAGRRRIGQGRGNCKRRSSAKNFLLDFGADRAHAPGSPVHWRRYWTDASGGRVENSGSGNFWSDKPGAQRPLWHAIDCAAKRKQYDRSHPARRTGTRFARNHGR